MEKDSHVIVVPRENPDLASKEGVLFFTFCLQYHVCSLYSADRLINGFNYLMEVGSLLHVVGPVLLKCTRQESSILQPKLVYIANSLWPSLVHPVMAELRHLVLVKYKEGVVVEEQLESLGKLVSELDIVKSFEWGCDVGSDEMLRQGFTHAILLTFKSAEDFTAYLSHPKHLEFASIFAASIEKVLLFDFPAVVVKA